MGRLKRSRPFPVVDYTHFSDADPAAAISPATAAFRQFKMISSSLSSLSAEDWRNIASFVVTPAFAFAAAYVFAVDLVKIPFASTDVPYKIPTRAIAMIAFTFCFSASFATAVWITLKVYPGPEPGITEFRHQFFRPLTTDEQAWVRPVEKSEISRAVLILEEYDGSSDFRVFVNNRRLIGTYVDCMWKFQCSPETEHAHDDVAIKAETDAAGVRINSYLFPFPDTRRGPLDLLPYLRPGTNYVDLFSNNSGVRSCQSTVKIMFTDRDNHEIAHEFQISDGHMTITPYRTIPELPAFRTCDQIRIRLRVRL